MEKIRNINMQYENHYPNNILFMIISFDIFYKYENLYNI